MSDGEGCRCADRSESECGCDADWTPQELVDARDEIARLRLTDEERAALRDAIGFYINEWGATDDLVVNDSPICRILRGLLERLGGGK